MLCPRPSDSSVGPGSPRDKVYFGEQSNIALVYDEPVVQTPKSKRLAVRRQRRTWILERTSQTVQRQTIRRASADSFWNRPPALENRRPSRINIIDECILHCSLTTPLRIVSQRRPPGLLSTLRSTRFGKHSSHGARPILVRLHGRHWRLVPTRCSYQVVAASQGTCSISATSCGVPVLLGTAFEAVSYTHLTLPTKA